MQHKSMLLRTSSFYFRFKKIPTKFFIKAQHFVFYNPQIQHLGLLKTILLLSQRSDPIKQTLGLI